MDGWLNLFRLDAAQPQAFVVFKMCSSCLIKNLINWRFLYFWFRFFSLSPASPIDFVRTFDKREREKHILNEEIKMWGGIGAVGWGAVRTSSSPSTFPAHGALQNRKPSHQDTKTRDDHCPLYQLQLFDRLLIPNGSSFLGLGQGQAQNCSEHHWGTKAILQRFCPKTEMWEFSKDNLSWEMLPAGNGDAQFNLSWGSSWPWLQIWDLWKRPSSIIRAGSRGNRGTVKTHPMAPNSPHGSKLTHPMAPIFTPTAVLRDFQKHKNRAAPSHP